MIPKKELVMLLLDSLPTNSRASYTKIHKLLYLVDKRFKERYKQGIGYDFNSFMIHTGPYDKELQDDLDVWLTAGLMHNCIAPYETKVRGIYVPTHDVRLTELGKSFLKEIGVNRLANFLGSEQEIQWIRKMISEYAVNTDRALVEETVRHWLQDHPDQISEIKTFFPFIAEAK